MSKIIKQILISIISISIILILFVSVIIVPSVISNWIMSIRLNQIQPEIEDNITYCLYDTLYFSGDKLNVEEILEAEGYALQEYLVKNDDEIYMIISSAQTYSIAKIKTDGTGLHILFQDIFFENTSEPYKRRSDKAYFERYGYYDDGKIILTDHSKLVEYSILDDSYKVCQYQDYVFPESAISGEYLGDDILAIQSSGNAQTYELDKLISDSQSIKQLYEYRYDADESGAFVKVIQLMQDELYVIGAVSDFTGCGDAILMKYDSEEQQLRYHSYYDGKGADAHVCWYYYVVEDVVVN